MMNNKIVLKKYVNGEETIQVFQVSDKKLQEIDDFFKRPIHKLNGGNGATLCVKCSVVICTGLKDILYCKNCMKMKQQTAVDWLDNDITELDEQFDIDLIGTKTYWIKRNEILEEANKMFEQQIIDAYDKGFIFGVAMLKQKQEEYVNGKKYFNQTFNK